MSAMPRKRRVEGRPVSPTAHRLGAVALLAPACSSRVLAFLVPLARLVGLSFSAPAGPFVAYAHLLGDDIYARVFANTFVDRRRRHRRRAAHRLSGRLRADPAVAHRGAASSSPACCCRCGSACSCAPSPGCCCWSATARSTASSSRADSAISRCRCCSITPRVLIGMVHVLLPYAVLPIYAALVRIDPDAAPRERRARRFGGRRRSCACCFRCRCVRRRDGGDVHVPAGARLFRDAGAARRRLQHHAVDADRRLRQRPPRLAARRGGVGRAAGGGAGGRRGRRALRSASAPSQGASMSVRIADDRPARAQRVRRAGRGVPGAADPRHRSRGVQRAELHPPAAGRLVAALVGRVLQRRLVAGHAAREPESRGVHDADFGRRRNRRGARHRAERPARSRAADGPVPGPRRHAGDRARRRAVQHGARHGSRRHD